MAILRAGTCKGFACIDCMKSKDKAAKSVYDARRSRANPGAAVIRARAWALNNSERRKEIARKWDREHPLALRAKQHRRRSRLASAAGNHTEHDIHDLLRIQRGLCAGCECKLSTWHIDHVIPLSRGGSNWVGNLQLLCQPCNQSKCDRLPIEWKSGKKRSIRRVIISSEMLRP